MIISMKPIIYLNVTVAYYISLQGHNYGSVRLSEQTTTTDVLSAGQETASKPVGVRPGKTQRGTSGSFPAEGSPRAGYVTLTSPCNANTTLCRKGFL